MTNYKLQIVAIIIAAIVALLLSRATPREGFPDKYRGGYMLRYGKKFPYMVYEYKYNEFSPTRPPSRPIVCLPGTDVIGNDMEGGYMRDINMDTCRRNSVNKQGGGFVFAANEKLAGPKSTRTLGECWVKNEPVKVTRDNARKGDRYATCIYMNNNPVDVFVDERKTPKQRAQL